MSQLEPLRRYCPARDFLSLCCATFASLNQQIAVLFIVKACIYLSIYLIKQILPWDFFTWYETRSGALGTKPCWTGWYMYLNTSQAPRTEPKGHQCSGTGTPAQARLDSIRSCTTVAGAPHVNRLARFLVPVSLEINKAECMFESRA